VATATVTLKATTAAGLFAQAEYMSVGPAGPLTPDTLSAPDLSIVDYSFRRLRVTIGSCERNTVLWIDDIVTRRADTRTVKAEYLLSWFDPPIRDLYAALPRVVRVLGPEPTAPPVRWTNPTSFVWVMHADTLFVEQRADSVFQVTLRARVR
jgi:hypothetical protein